MRCPARAPEEEKVNYGTSSTCPKIDRSKLERIDIRTSQLISAVWILRRLSGCGETPYIKLLTQLYSGRMLIANATGCSLHLRRQLLDTVHYRRQRPAVTPAWASARTGPRITPNSGSASA